MGVSLYRVFIFVCVWCALGKAAEKAAYAADTAGVSPLGDIDVRLIGDVRLRYQNTNLSSEEEDIERVTGRLRLGIEADLSDRFTILVEGEGLVALHDEFDFPPLILPGLPNLDDPNALEVNRAQLLARIKEQAFVTFGRQRLVVDDQRFLGSAAFRLNEQTFDGIHFFARTKSEITFQAGYFRQFNGPLGPNADFGRFNGDSYYANVNAPTPIGRIGVFHYAFDLETGPEDARTSHFSSRTSGFRYDGRWHADEFGFDVEASYARQTDFADHPEDFVATYWLVGGLAYAGPLRFGIRQETLGAGDGEPIQTPAGSRHRFQGDADVFVITPLAGLKDREITAAWEIGRFAKLSNVRLSASYHWFDAQAVERNFGTEFDFRATARWNSLDFGLVYADYNANTFFEDTRRIYLSISKGF